MFTHPLTTDLSACHFAGILLVIFLATIHERLKHRSSAVLLILWNLVGVVLHELAHLTIGTLLFARPAGFSIFPTRGRIVDARGIETTHWTLGSVDFRRINSVNALPVGLAPLSLAGLAYVLYRHWFTWFPNTGASTLSMYAVIYILLYNSVPSGRDLRVAFRPGSCLLYLAVGAFVFIVLKGKI
jgi:hypothetical protein